MGKEKLPRSGEIRRELFTRWVPAIMLVTLAGVWATLRPSDSQLRDMHNTKNTELLSHFDRGDKLYYNGQLPVVSQKDAEIILLEERGPYGEEMYVVKLKGFTNYAPLPLHRFEIRK